MSLEKKNKRKIGGEACFKKTKGFKKKVSNVPLLHECTT
jgi:hypothetical protein